MSTPELARRTGHDRKFFYDRFLFLKAFSTDDLDAIAAALGITAADIIKLAMLRVRDRLSTEGMEGRLVLQVHDELIVECPAEEADRICSLVEEEMERVISLSVPLLAETSAGKSWADAH